MILLAKKILFQDSSDECPDYPCEAIWEKENRYQEKYVLKESPIQNLKEIHEVGMQTFLQRQKQRFADYLLKYIKVEAKKKKPKTITKTFTLKLKKKKNKWKINDDNPVILDVVTCDFISAFMDLFSDLNV